MDATHVELQVIHASGLLHHFVSVHDFDVLDSGIAEGAHPVIKVRRKGAPVDVSLKALKQLSLSGLRAVQREVAIPSVLHHPNVVRPEAVFFDEESQFA